MSPDPPEQRLTRDLQDLFGKASAKIPPPVVRAMEADIREWEPGRRIVMAFPTLERYAGPTGFVQGGVLAAAFDNAFGPVAYTAVGRMVVSVGLSVSFVRPVPVSVGHFLVEAHLVEATRRFAFVRGEASRPDGKLVAACSSELVAAHEGDEIV